MAHVLLVGVDAHNSDIRSLIRSQGMTIGRWDPHLQPDPFPTIEDCDVVVQVGVTEDCFQPAASADSCVRAPWILVAAQGGSWLPDTLIQSRFETVPDARSGLVEALHSCCKTTVGPVGQFDEPAHYSNYTQFLGHELRSPLTAVKTALEVLHGDLGGLEEGTVDPHLKMLELAMRNVGRLQRTVDWSQDFLAQAETTPTACRQWLSLQALLSDTDLPQVFDAPPALDEIYLETDPDLVQRIIRQMRQVVEYSLPDRPIGMVLAVQGTDLVVRVEAADPDESAEYSAPVARTHLVSVGTDGCDLLRDTLTSLSSFMVARPMLALLGGDLQICDDDQNRPGLSLRLKLADVSTPETCDLAVTTIC